MSRDKIEMWSLVVMMLGAFVAFAVFASMVKAEVPEVTVEVWTVGRAGLVRRATRRARWYLRSFPVKVRLKRTGRYHTSKTIDLSQVQRIVRELPQGENPRIYIWTKSIFMGEGKWTSGLASYLCAPNIGTALATITRRNVRGESRLEEGAGVIAHEIGHLLGATHDSHGLMNPSGLLAAGQALGELGRTQITNCLSKG